VRFTSIEWSISTSEELLRVWGLTLPKRKLVFEFGAWGFRFWDSGFGIRDSCFEIRVLGFVYLEIRVSGFGFQISGFRIRISGIRILVLRVGRRAFDAHRVVDLHSIAARCGIHV